MAKPKAVVLYGDGINCDAETAWALNNADFEATSVHTSKLLENPNVLLDAKLLAIPGGFSYGDEIASGKVLAIKLKESLKETFYNFVGKGGLVIGICNGFQVLVQMGLLPHSEPNKPRIVSLVRNSHKRFVNRWVDMTVSPKSQCKFFESLETISLPMRHGEGRISLDINADAQTKQSQESFIKDHAPLRYKEDVNGSFDRIAALTNNTGTVLGMMPHPEAFLRSTQHPEWTERKWQDPSSNRQPDGIVIFKNIRKVVN